MLYCLTVVHSYIRLGICVYCFLKLAVVHPSEEFEVSNVNRKSRTVTFHCIVQIVQPVKFIIIMSLTKDGLGVLWSRNCS